MYYQRDHLMAAAHQGWREMPELAREVLMNKEDVQAVSELGCEPASEEAQGPSF